MNKLTKRELEILQALVDCKTNPEISKAFNITVNTVKMHCKSIFKKLNARNRSDAGIKAILNGIISV